MALSFKGGVHVEEHKRARGSSIEKLPPPHTVAIPLSQHIGAHAKSIVKAGETVDKGQLIGDNEQGLSCPVHASISGKVLKIEPRYLPNGVKVDHIIIENDYEERLSVNIKPFNKKITDTTFDEIVSVVKSAGISGMGGATFPTHAKLQSARDKVTTLIINAAECEPFITANHRLMLEHPEQIINGMKILLKAFELKVGYIAIEDNKLNAADKIEELIVKSKLVEIRILKTKYPQGDERQLIYALTGKELPAGKLPADVGCVVFNVETCAAICDAFVMGLPLIERIVTVDGDCIITPKNLRVPLGVPVSSLIEYCGLKRHPEKIINGGPMMGIAIWDISMPVTKGTSAVLAFSERQLIKKNSACIHCGKCVDGCPMRLMPAYIAAFSKKEDLEMCEKYDIMSCVECGCCTYICPASVPIVQFIRTAKGRIQENRQKAVLIEQAKKLEAEDSGGEYRGRSAAAGKEREHD